jgi:hypothetical protein
MSESIHWRDSLRTVVVLWILVLNNLELEQLTDRLVPLPGRQLKSHDARKAGLEGDGRLDMSPVRLATWHPMCFEGAVLELCHRALVDFAERWNIAYRWDE